MLKKASLLIMLAAFILVIAACGASKNNTPQSAVEVIGADESSISEEVIIKASNWEFDQPTYTIKKGETVKLTLESLAGIHGIKIDKLNVTLDGGKSKVIKVDEPGEYDFHCNIQCGQGHNKMRAKLIVE